MDSHNFVSMFLDGLDSRFSLTLVFCHYLNQSILFPWSVPCYSSWLWPGCWFLFHKDCFL